MSHKAKKKTPKTKPIAVDSIPSPAPVPPWMKAEIEAQQEADIDLAALLDGAEETKLAPKDKLAKKKSEGEELHGKKAPADRKSVYGAKYANSYESEWQEFPGAGWVHESERWMFKDGWFQSQLSQKWFTKGRRTMAYLSEESSDPKVVSYDELDGKDWIQCGYSGHFVRKAWCFDYLYGSQTSWAHKQFKEEFKKCDVSGVLMHPHSFVHVKQSPKYKCISHKAFENSDLFEKCEFCGNIFEAAMVPNREDIGSKACDQCYSKQKYKYAIAPWNDKHYPQALGSKVTRYGHRIGDDGLIYATNKREEVKIVRRFGCEAEVELHKPAVVAMGLNRFELALAVKKVLGTDFVNVKEDGTLTMNGKYDGNSQFDPDGTKNGPMYAGFEIVSAPADIAIHRERWFLLDEAKELHDGKGNRLLRAWDTTTCGFHVHVTREALTSLQIGRILRFINHPNNQRFVFKVAGRSSDKYCRYLEKEFSDALHPERVISPEEHDNYNRKRRTAVNVSNPHTIEFRIFRGTIHPRHIIRNIEFCDAVCDFCHPGSRPLWHMNDFNHFIQFVDQNRKHWPLLAEWLAVQDFIRAPKLGPKADKSKLTLKLESVAEPEPIVPIPEPELELTAAAPTPVAAGDDNF